MYRQLAIATAFAVTGSASAQLWDNGMTEFGSSAWVSMRDPYYPFHSQVADDFRLNEIHSFTCDVKITSLTFAGVYNDNPPDDAVFNLILYGSLGGFPSGMGSDDPTSVALDVRTIPLADLDIEPISYWENIFIADLSDDPFLVDPSLHYWIAIQYEAQWPPDWSWFVTDEGITGKTAVFGFPFLDVPYWTVLETPADMAFSFDGHEVAQVADITGDCTVDVLDLLELLNSWGACPDPRSECPADLHEDGVVDVVDLLLLLMDWT